MAVNPYGLYDYYPQEEPQGDKATVSEQFNPRYSKTQLQSIIRGYKNNPRAFNKEQIEQIKKHAIYHNVGFYAGDFSISDALKQFLGGALEGFTTFSVVDPPDNEYEAIARNVGHLLGFAPGMAAKPLKLLGANRAANVLGGIKSVPLGIGEYATKKARKAVSPIIRQAIGRRSDATGVVAKFLTSGATKSVIDEGMKLGVASAVSNWKQGVDGMIEAGVGGAKFGAAFGALGNMIPGKGAGSYALRAISGSIFQGLPATQRGATTPEQVYEYLLGAYFGGGATGWKQQGAQKFMVAKEKQATGSGGKKGDPKLRATNDPSLVKEWKNLDPEVKKEVIEMMTNDKYDNGKPSIHYDPDVVKAGGFEARTAFQEFVAKGLGIEPSKTTLTDKGWAEFVKRVQSGVFKEQNVGLATETKKDLNKIFEDKKILVDKLNKEKLELDKKEGAERLLAEENIKKLEGDLADLNESERGLLELEPGQFIDKESGEIEVEPRTNDGNDIGMTSSMDLYRKSEIFVQDKLSEVWDKPKTSPNTKRNEVIRLTDMLDTIIKGEKYMRKGQRVNTKELVEDIVNEFKIKENIDIRSKIDAETVNNFRQWLTRKNFGEPVKYRNVSADKDGKVVSNKVRGEDNFTLAGNRIQNIESKKEIQRVLEELVPGTKEDSHFIFDNVTVAEKGRFVDMGINQYRKYLIAKNKSDEGGVKAYQKFIKEMHNNMLKEGYYPFGGKGDNDTIIYIKKHPDMAKGASKAYIGQYLDNFLSKPSGKKGYLNRDFYNMAIRRNKNFSETEAKDQYLSNIMWDLSLNGFKPKTAKEYYRDLKKLFENDGYIKNATAWNKRNQIWFTPTWRADKKFVGDSYSKYLKTIKDSSKYSTEFKDASKNGVARYIIARDLDPKLFSLVNNKLKRIKLLDKNSKNTEHGEHVDGMIIVEDGYLKSLIKDSGMPGEGQSKSFIVSPDATNGALLGKYMMHSAGEVASKQMREAGLHMIMQDSAVKQRGERKVTDYTLTKDKLNIEDPSLVYELPLEHIKYSYNVKQSNTMAGYNPDGSVHKHGIPKQLLMAMAQNTHHSFPRRLIEDFFNETIYKKYEGDATVNKTFQEYMDNPKSTQLLRLLEKNVDKLGIDNLLQAINGKHTDFTDVAYMRLMKINRENVSERIAEGDITAQEGQKILENINEFNSATDRIIDAAQKWSQSEKIAGRPGNINTVLLHKYIRPYRFQVIRNYVFQSLSKPKIGNSGVARMRGFDKWFQRDAKFKDLENRDDIFFLDESFRKMPLRTHIPGFEKTTLEELWHSYRGSGKMKKPLDKEYKMDAKQVLRALTVRVPMDSTSGAQALEFAGFTGRKGHGILMHSRAMRAEGGADLDGDEAHIFFGGRKGGKGDGFKSEWTETFHKNKDEYLDPKTGRTPDRKEGIVPGEKITYEEYLTTQDDYVKTGIDPVARDSKVWQYDSNWREGISQRAVEGRDLLGGTVTMTQVLKSAHNSMLKLPKKENKFTITVKANYGKKPYTQKISIEARDNKSELKNARQLASSMVAFTSDPLDVAGLKGYADYVSKLGNAYFKVKIDGREVKLNNENYKILTNKNGIIGQMFDINSALYSRDFSNNRSWDAQSIKDKTRYLNYEDGLGLESAQNTMLTKMGKIANQVDLYDSPFLNINKTNLFRMYKEHNYIVDQLPEFSKLLKNLKVEKNPLVDAIIRSGLWNKNQLDKAAESLKTFDAIMKYPGSPYARGNAWNYKISKKNRALVRKSEQYRRDQLKELLKFSEDILTQDVSDMVSFRQLYRYYDRAEIGEVLFGKILKDVSALRRDSYLQRKDLEKPEEVATDDIIPPSVRKSFGELKAEGKERSRTLDQAEVDARIAQIKATLPNPRAQKLFDMLMLGTFRNKTTSTSISKLGMSSRSVDQQSVIDFIGDYATVMNKAYERTPVNETFIKNIEKGQMSEKDTPEGTILKDTTTGYEGLHGKPDMAKIPKKIRQELTELVERLKFYNGKVGQNLNEITRAVIGKDFNAMQYKNFVDLNNYFKEVQRGTVAQRIFGDFRKAPKDLKSFDRKENVSGMKAPLINKRNSWLFPLTLNRETMRYDIELLQKRGLFVTKDGKVVEGDIQVPSNFTERLQHDVTMNLDKAQAKGEEMVGMLREKLEFIDALEDGESLRRIAVRKIERDGNVSKNLHSDKVLSKNWARNYLKEYDREVITTDYNQLRNNTYRINETINGVVKRREYTGEQIVEKITDVYKNHFKDMYRIISGNKELLDSYHLRNKKGEKLYWDIKDFHKYDRTKPEEPVYDYRRFVNDIRKAYERGEDITTEFGIDGLRQIARSMMIKLHNKRMQVFKSRAKLRKELLLPKDTGEIAEGYWPHMFFDKNMATKALKEALETINKSNISKSDKEAEINKIQWRHKTLTGDWITGLENWEAYENAVDPLKIQAKSDKVTWFQANQMTGAMHQRTTHIPGWSIDATVPEAYSRNVFNTYYKQLAQIMSRDILVDFDQQAFAKGWHKIQFDPKTGRSLKDRWLDHYKLYVQDAMGHPSIIPDYMINDPGMKLKGTPYAWWADNKVKDKVNKIAKKLGVKEDLPGIEKFSVADITRWSNLEAKYELATLLAHPKSMINNLFGGSLHTIQSAGAKSLRKVYDYNFLRTINPDWTNKQAVLDFIKKQGVFPEMLQNEWGMQKELQSVNTKRFLKEVGRKLNKDGEIEPKSFKELAKEYKITEPIFKTAAKFMSKPEMTLRKDAFMTHYIKAWERFGGAITQFDHPFLIEMAKKGVKATQFLYSAPYRPGFARTALGKIMTRFQLWSWNAARFRNDVIREARIRGYREGTPEYQKFKRTMQIDLLVYALGSVFTMSLFDLAIPAPLNHFKETSEWIFGDEKERQRAFWGTYPTAIAPLQMITPPIARAPMSILKTLTDDNYDKFLDYHIYTMFPFGRIVRDIAPFAKGNIIDNPYRTVEKFTGIPYGDIQRERRKLKEQQAYHPVYRTAIED